MGVSGRLAGKRERTRRCAVLALLTTAAICATAACTSAGQDPEPTTTLTTSTTPATTAPTSAEPTTPEPTTAEPTSASPEPTSPEPTTTEPTTAPPTTRPPTTPPPTTPPPTTAAPTTPAPTTPSLPAGWAGVDWEVLPTSRNVVALTFDGGASNTGVATILQTLGSYGVRATFFPTGQFARAYPDSVRAMAAAGHDVGNHSDTHPYFSTSTNVVIREQLAAAEASISALTGRSTKPLFRFPYGDRGSLDIKVVNGEGYIPFRWTVDTLGWKGTKLGGITAAIVCERVMNTARAGQIVLMHVGANPDDGTTLDADALPCIIQGLRDRGYGFVTLREFTG